jgi:hypothetical protein
VLSWPGEAPVLNCEVAATQYNQLLRLGMTLAYRSELSRRNSLPHLSGRRVTDCGKWRMYRAALEASPLAYEPYKVLPTDGDEKLLITLHLMGL